MKTGIIIDDMEMSRQNLIYQVKTSSADLSIIGQAANIEEGVQLIENLNPDILFLDVELQNGLIFPLFEQIDHSKYNIVFVTAHKHHAFQAFKHNAIDYILKPIEAEEIERVAHKVNQHHTMLPSNVFAQMSRYFSSPLNSENLGISTQNGVVFVNLKDIICIEGDRNYSTMLTPDQKHVLSKPLNHYENLLPFSIFFRAHKSYIVNINHIKSYKRNAGGMEIKMSSGKIISVSRRKKAEFLNLLRQNNLIID